MVFERIKKNNENNSTHNSILYVCIKTFDK